MVQKVGIDFGTTNSLISVITRDNRAKSFVDSDRPHPSVVRYEGERVVCGKKAWEKMEQRSVGVLGNTVRGPKKLISSETINVEGRLMTPVEVIGDYIKFLVKSYGFLKIFLVKLFKRNMCATGLKVE